MQSLLFNSDIINTHMNKNLVSLFILVLITIGANAQTKKYTEKSICTSFETYRGKKNYGKKYCVAWIEVRYNFDYTIDTIGWFWDGGRMFSNAFEMEQYYKLTPRNKIIYDSLAEDGLINMNSNYLMYEPHYMKPGEKTKQFYGVYNNEIKVYTYKLWNNNNGSGYRLISERIVK